MIKLKVAMEGFQIKEDQIIVITREILLESIKKKIVIKLMNIKEMRRKRTISLCN